MEATNITKKSDRPPTCDVADRPIERASHFVFVGSCAAAFAASVAVTIRLSQSMSSAGAMNMPGGWSMSTVWMRMRGQTWLEAAGSFVGMWIVMMIAMMLPSLVPMLSRYRQLINPANQAHLGRLTGVAALGYFFVWTMVGMATFSIGVGLAAAQLHENALASLVPVAVSLVIILAGALQFSRLEAQ